MCVLFTTFVCARSLTCIKKCQYFLLLLYPLCIRFVAINFLSFIHSFVHIAVITRYSVQLPRRKLSRLCQIVFLSIKRTWSINKDFAQIFIMSVSISDLALWKLPPRTAGNLQWSSSWTSSWLLHTSPRCMTMTDIHSFVFRPLGHNSRSCYLTPSKTRKNPSFDDVTCFQEYRHLVFILHSLRCICRSVVVIGKKLC